MSGQPGEDHRERTGRQPLVPASAEYELVGTHTTTGVTASAPFLGVLRTRDGKLARRREYQHTLAIAQAVGQG